MGYNFFEFIFGRFGFCNGKTKWSYKKLTLVVSFLGIAFALMGIVEYFFVFLNTFGVLIPSISSIYLIHFFWIKKQRYGLEEVQDWDFAALVSWGTASTIAFCTYLELFQLTHAYFVDSFLLCGLIYIILEWKEIRK